MSKTDVGGSAHWCISRRQTCFWSRNVAWLNEWLRLCVFGGISIVCFLHNHRNVSIFTSREFSIGCLCNLRWRINQGGECINPFLRKTLGGGIKYPLSALPASFQPLAGGIGIYSVLSLFATVSHRHLLYFKHWPRPKKKKVEKS